MVFDWFITLQQKERMTRCQLSYAALSVTGNSSEVVQVGQFQHDDDDDDDDDDDEDDNDDVEYDYDDDDNELTRVGG